MSDQHLSHSEWLSQLNEYLERERYASITAAHRVSEARQFLTFLDARHIEVAAVQPSDVDRYLHQRLHAYRRRYGHPPADNWRVVRINPIRMFLQLAQGQWPPAPKPATRAERFRHQLCEQYVQWMVDVRGLAPATISKRCREARHFLSWLGKRASRVGIATLLVADVDRYLRDRSSSLRRSSVSLVTVRTRVFLRWLHSTGQTNRDLSTAVITPSLYAFESIPSALRSQDVEKVLAAVQQDGTRKGIRDYAILMLLSKYGVRAGEIIALRLDDIDWRKEVIRVRQTKTGTVSYLPLLDEVGDAILKYLQKARPKTAIREIFTRDRAPYLPFKNLYTLIRKRLDAAGVVTSGRRGPHAFRHARAVGMLRAAVPLKEIGDMLGHRACSSTMTYLKLATEDLRAIALEIPAGVKA